MGAKRRAGNGKSSLGHALLNDQKRADPKGRGPERACGVDPQNAGRSVVEQSGLDDFLATAALLHTTFEASRSRGTRLQTNELPTLLKVAPSDAAIEAAQRAVSRLVVPMPWRPVWQEGISAASFSVQEGEAFVAWRRSLAALEEQHDLVFTPYERNLDIWRQLWMCIERSDVVVQILDARNPNFYHSVGLERYVLERFAGKKRLLLLLNKADFLSRDIRSRWADWYTKGGSDMIFFSALRELHALEPLGGGGERKEDADWERDEEREEEVHGRLCDEVPRPPPPHGPLEAADALDVLDCARFVKEIQARMPPGSQGRGVVGFVGYPNVGKSSVVNALLGSKKVSISRTPGKTKHLQTCKIPATDVTLCDCPGLVFPKLVGSKAHLVINGTVPIEGLRDYASPMRLVVHNVGLGPICNKYGLDASRLSAAAPHPLLSASCPEDLPRRLLALFAASRGHFLQLHAPDESWAARKVLTEYCSGALLHCAEPDDSLPRRTLLGEETSPSRNGVHVQCSPSS